MIFYLDAGSVFGELWKLEPLSEERKKKWELEMDWLLSPTNYMIELVPAKQNGSNGSILEVILITDFVMMIHYCRQIESRLYDHLLFMFGADNDTESSCRHSHESSSITEVGFHASCRWSLQSWNLII